MDGDASITPGAMIEPAEGEPRRLCGRPHRDGTRHLARLPGTAGETQARRESVHPVCLFVRQVQDKGVCLPLGIAGDCGLIGEP